MVVQSEGLDVPDDLWQRVFDFRVAVESGSVDADSTQEIRSTHDVEGNLPEAVERPVVEAARAVAQGDEDRAIDILQDAFPTPCANDDPGMRETPAGHEAACHHYGDD